MALVLISEEDARKASLSIHSILLEIQRFRRITGANVPEIKTPKLDEAEATFNTLQTELLNMLKKS